MKNNQLTIRRSSLFDKLSLYGINDYGKFIKFPHILNRKSGKIEGNPIYESFRNVSSLGLESNSIEDTIGALSDAIDLELSISKYFFRAKNLEEIAQITNPKFF